MWWRLVCGTLWAATALCLGDAWLRGPAGSAWAARHLQAAAQRHGLTVQHHGLRVALLPPSLQLDRWSAAATPKAMPFCWGAASSATLYPFTGWAPPTLQRLEVSGLQVDARRPLPTPTQKRRDAPPVGLPIDVRHLLITDAHLVVPLPTAVMGHPTTVQAAHVDLQIDPASRELRGYRLRIATLHSQPDGLEQLLVFWAGVDPATALPRGAAPWRIEATGRLQGTLAEPHGLRLNQATAHHPELHLQASGAYERRPPPNPAAPPGQPTFDFALQGNADLAALQRRAPQRWPLGGQLTASLHGHGTGQRQQWRGSCRVHNLTLRRRPLGELRSTWAWHEGRLEVPSLQLQQVTGGTVEGSGEVDMRRRDHPVQAALTLRNASLPHLLQAAGFADPWLRVRLDGSLRLQGNLRPRRLQLSGAATATDLQILRHSFALPDATPPVVRLASSSIAGKALWAAGKLTLSPTVLATQHSALTVSGVVDAARRVDLSIQSSGVRLEELGPLGGAALGGTARFSGSIVGPLQHLEVRAPLQVRGLHLLQHALGDARAQLHYSAPRLRFDALRLQPVGDAHGATALHGALQLDFLPTTVQLHSALQLDGIELAQLLAQLTPTLRLRDHLQGRVVGAVNLDGPLPLPDIELLLHTEGLRSGSLEAGQLHLAARRRQQLWDGTASLQTPQRGTAMLRAEQSGATAWRLDGSLHQAPLGLLNALADGAQFAGTVDGTLELHGPLRRLAGALRLEGQQVKVLDAPVGCVRLGGMATEGRLALQGVLHDSPSRLLDDPLDDPAALPFFGQLTLHGRLPFFLQAKLDPLDAGFLLPQLAELQLQLDGSVALRGELADAQALQLDLRLQAANLQLGTTRLRLRQPTWLRYAQGVLTLPSTGIVGPLYSGVVGGTYGPQRRLQAHCDGHGDAGLLQPLLPPEWVAHGPFELHGRAAGTSHDPQLAGSAKLHDGTLLYTPTQQNISAISSQITFLGNSAVVQYGRARVGGGTVYFFGEAVRPASASGRALQLNLRSSLRHVAWLFPFDLQATVSGDLQLVGPSGDLLLRGGLRVEKARYSARFEFDQLIPKKVLLPLRTQVGHPADAIRLRLHLAAPGNVMVVSPVLQAELQGDLTLTGTSDRPGLLGSITPRWARARYRDNHFEVERAAIDFLEEFRIFTAFELQARTHACNINADVLVRGNSDHYSIVASGQDSRGTVDPQDVLSCLQFGLRLHDFDSNQRNPATYGDALPGSLDALWTVSGLDSKVRRVLPIGVDELRLTSGWSTLSQRTTARVLIGKQLGDGLSLKYSRALDEYNDQALILEYALPDPAALQTNWMSARDMPIGDFGVDVRLFWELR